ncbi:glycosyltransferase family 4 protein [Microbacterium sp. SD291]|uniref:glycosyltransferase family 4 protein n=1 Tax=Microbacterium sp. SD291 TaxID=2782007 RepID=UPI001A9724E7|nr:glycosyltransferase family 4 protein [Microbacterium sp. SD291]MBO0979387.1 glycosyltransferase family 4 protein [Microbacterium sp. SD291]
MQIAVLTTWFPTTRNPGAGSFIARDVKALAEDHDVHVIHLVPPELDDGARSRRHGDVRVAAFPLDVRTPRGLLAATRQVPDLLGDAGIVHTMAAPALLPFLLRRPDRAWVHTEHWSGVRNLSASPKARLALPLSRRAFAGPDRVIAVSEFLADAVRRVRRGPVDVIGNIVDLPDADARAGETLFRGAKVKVLGVGTVKEPKGWRLAVDAVQRLTDDGLDAELLWLGDGPEFAELAASADGRVIIAPGHVSATAVGAAMSEADVFVLPTRSETFSLATVEALMAGLPVVATGTGAHSGFIAPGTGFVVPREGEQIARGVLGALQLDRAGIASHGRALAERFGEGEFRRRYTQIYEEVNRG